MLADDTMLSANIRTYERSSLPEASKAMRQLSLSGADLINQPRMCATMTGEKAQPQM